MSIHIFMAFIRKKHPPDHMNKRRVRIKKSKVNLDKFQEHKSQEYRNINKASFYNIKQLFFPRITRKVF